MSPTPAGRPVVRVIVVTYNSARHVAACLASLLVQEGVEVTIDVVDNASGDGTPGLVRRDFPAVALDEPGANLGYARANNRALARAVEPWIAIVNPDTVVPPGALAACVAALEADPAAGVAALRHQDEHGSPQATAFAFPALANLLGEALGLDRLLGGAFSTRPGGGFDPARPARVDWLQGSFLVVRRAALDRAGAFDPDYFMYGEDAEWGRRMADAGFAALYLPAPVVVHAGGGSTGAAAGPLFVESWKGRLRYFARHRGAAETTLARGLVAVAILGRLAVREAQAALLRATGRPVSPALALRLRLFRDAARWVAAGMPLAAQAPGAPTSRA